MTALLPKMWMSNGWVVNKQIHTVYVIPIHRKIESDKEVNIVQKDNQQTTSVNHKMADDNSDIMQPQYAIRPSGRV